MEPTSRPIYVTQPYLPPLEEFIPYLQQIWKNKWLTNAGPFHNELEAALAQHLEVPHLSLFANGTIGGGPAGPAHQRRGDHDTIHVCRDDAFAVVEWH